MAAAPRSARSGSAEVRSRLCSKAGRRLFTTAPLQLNSSVGVLSGPRLHTAR
eukprot:CAMPEP_0182930440 /NCGR_PEP_ID=MMETSP0105_2-20130417/25047_1 /TAXON_ID=81532 ORGANISM="Acanthoeca-like sp., Strain 10tr" /NCGR_SAMPLE_ID=MMETSP0105_2 /ASSEMBLY_ACC=CAM_ASM_000205 /LENGTH=51 /DNA_ID=CAMNT_0025068713 /DNA_START=142 /DNA_END=293 /DNA_ORIENTATION=+